MAAYTFTYKPDGTPVEFSFDWDASKRRTKQRLAANALTSVQEALTQETSKYWSDAFACGGVAWDDAEEKARRACELALYYEGGVARFPYYSIGSAALQLRSVDPRPTLRFPVGHNIMCRANDGWQTGVVISHWWQPNPETSSLRGWSNDEFAPYQLRVQSRDLSKYITIFARQDTDAYVRAVPGEPSCNFVRTVPGCRYRVPGAGAGAGVAAASVDPALAFHEGIQKLEEWLGTDSDGDGDGDGEDDSDFQIGDDGGDSEDPHPHVPGAKAPYMKAGRFTLVAPPNKPRPALRFELGTRVEALSYLHKPLVRRTGIVVRHWWHPDQFPADEYAPYLIMLDDAEGTNNAYVWDTNQDPYKPDYAPMPNRKYTLARFDHDGCVRLWFPGNKTHDTTTTTTTTTTRAGCDWCGCNAKLKTCACGTKRFCGKQCQADAWPTHKAACKQARRCL